MKHKMDETLWKRDREFRAGLARELGVEQPPESFRRALDEIYAELPDELPVRRRPLRSALRGMAVAAASLALICASMFGVNALNPELMEKIPGLGQVFQAINGTERLPELPEVSGVTPVVSVEPSPTPQPEPQGFQAVKTESTGDFDGALTVRNAWSDGRFLTLELALEDRGAADREKYEYFDVHSLDAQTLPNGKDDTSLVTVDGVPAEKTAPNYQDLAFRRNDDTGTLYATWVLELPQELAEPKELTVHLEIPEFYALDRLDEEWVPEAVKFEPGFSADFQVTADPSENVRVTEPSSDNGTTLLSVDSTPTLVKIEMEIPFLGRVGYTLLDGFLPGHSGNPQPLGTAAVLETEDGEPVEESWGWVDEEEGFDFMQVQELGMEQPYRGTLAFDGPPRGTKRLVLTLYEYMEGGFGTEDPEARGRVSAEFTIDLETGSVSPSENYLQAGLQKLDGGKSREEPRCGTPENGFYSTYPSLLGRYPGQDDKESSWVLNFYSEDLEYRPTELRYYVSGELQKVMKSHPAEEYNAGEPGLEAIDRYEDETGQYLEGLTDPRYTQKQLKCMTFVVFCTQGIDTDWQGVSLRPNRFELVDAETGEVLVADLELSYWKRFDELFGTHRAETFRNGLPVQEGNSQDTSSGVETSGTADSTPLPPAQTPEPESAVPPVAGGGSPHPSPSPGAFSSSPEP